MLAASRSVYSNSVRSNGAASGEHNSAKYKSTLGRNTESGSDNKTDGSIRGKDNSEAETTSRAVRYLRFANLGIMSLVLVGYGMCSSLFSPFFPTEAAKRGISATVVGFIFGTYTFMMFIGSLISGQLVRVLGIPFMISAGTLLAGGSTVLFGLLDQAPANEAYVILCFAVRFIEGCGGSLYNTAVYSLVAQLYPQSLSTAYAVLEISNAVGTMIGPSVGGILFNAGGFSLPFYVVGAMLLVFGFISMVLLHFTFTVPKASSGTEKKETTKRLPWSHFYRVSVEIRIITITLATSALVSGFPSPTLALYYEQIGLSDPAAVGLVFLGSSLSYTLVSLIVGKLADTYTQYAYFMMAFGAVLLAAGYFLLGPFPPMQTVLPPSVTLTTVSYIVLFGGGLGILINPAPAAIISAARAAGFPDGLDTAVMVASIYNAMWFLGLFISTPIAGGLMDAVGFAWGASIMAGIAVVVTMLFLYLLFMPRLKGQQSKQQYAYAAFNSQSETSVLIRKSEDN